MDDLHHGAAFVGAAGVEVRQDLDGCFVVLGIAGAGEFAVCYAGSGSAEVVIAIGEDADFYAFSFDMAFLRAR
ncbi:hypothetical protein ACQ86N_24735 [Puia sp. P3]|uniref:hypothetical protein n=1 Tax=Puia sp. P3 TaxID=3423952 RepID=UPI003D66F9FC